jgi:hypothetical protein
MFGDPTIVITKHDLDTLRADAVLKYAEYLQAEQRAVGWWKRVC